MNIAKQLERIGNLEYNWNNYGADKISKKVIDNVNFFFEVNKRKFKFNAVPNPYGTISLIRDCDAVILHLEIGETCFSFYSTVGKKYILGKELITEDSFKLVGKYIKAILRNR